MTDPNTSNASNNEKTLSYAYSKFVKRYMIFQSILIPVFLLVITLIYLIPSLSFNVGGYSGNTVRTWINGIYMGESQRYAQGNIAEIIVGLITLTFIFFIISIAVANKINRNYNPQKDGCSFSCGSRKRKMMLILSILFGIIGIDRLLMKRFLTGIIKAVIGFYSGVSIWMLSDGVVISGLPFLIILSTIVLSFIFWSVDVLLIHSGTAKERTRGKIVYLR